MIPEPCTYHELFDALEGGVLTNPEMDQLKTAGEDRATLIALLTTWNNSHTNVGFRGVCERTLALME